jgi:hypothetical protein
MMMMMMAPIAGMDVSEKKNCFPSRYSNHGYPACSGSRCKGGYTLVTLPRIVTPYRDSVDGSRDRVTYQKLVAR